MLKKNIKRYSILILIFSLTIFIIGCKKKDTNPELVQKDFEHFIHELFIDGVQSDSLTLNYALSQPENYGIELSKPTLGEYTSSRMYERLSETERNLKRLKNFSYDLLTEEQQLTYDILENYLELEIYAGNFIYYNQSLSPTTGFQAQLPILLAEYNFYTKKDIERYIELLPSVYSFFKDIAEFEREKANKGLFMSNTVADKIIDQCTAFIAFPDQNFLIEYFNEKIEDFEGLTTDEMNHYKKANEKGVKEYIIPAYELIINVLTDLKGSGTNKKGLYYYPDGKAYYEALTKYKTGSDKSMKKIIEMLENEIGDSILEITTISLMDPMIMDKYLSFHSFPITDPEEILSDLKTKISEDFPELIAVNCDIKYVHDSLSDYLSPAMYLVPAIDNYKNNKIYINGKDEITLSLIYTTIAHEGYPGHLYQSVYFRNQNPAPIRNLMNFIGYDEGWATYVEMLSYYMSGIDYNLAKFLECNNRAMLAMYARTDIGIHYEGWTKEFVVSYIMQLIGDEEIAETIYYILLEEPAVYLPYAVGYLEIKELRKKAEETMKEDFVAKEFHQFLLEIGPAQFAIIHNSLERWMENQVTANTIISQ